MTSKPTDYFVALYDASDDPWQLGERWYEQRKYALTMAVLPRHRYRHAFEPGCSVGVLTTALAARCDQVTATDVVPAALDAARTRVAAAGLAAGVRLLRRSIEEPWPQADLVVLSEVAYYLDEATLRALLLRESARLERGATVVAVHWRHPVSDYPLTGDQAAAIIGETPRLHPQARYVDEDVTIEVYTVDDGTSVARATGVPGVRT